MDYIQFLEEIIKSDKTIRSAMIFNKYGQIQEKAHRSNMQLYLNEYDSEKLLRESGSSWHYRQKLSYKLGKGIYVLAEYEHVRRITLPLEHELFLLITADNQDEQPRIVKQILNVIKEKES